jgi:hypothetical protein
MGSVNAKDTERLLRRGALPLVLVLTVVSRMAFAEDTIGAADGTSYEVVATEMIYNPVPSECLFNDLGAPNLGAYTREKRHYRTYSHGDLEKEWDQDVDTFKECVNP